MDNKTLRNLGKLYHLLDDACNPDGVNQADLDNALRFPVRGVTLKITLAHKLHRMTPELDRACAYALQDVTEEDVANSYALKALSLEQQGVFQLGYMSPDYQRLGVSSEGIRKAREAAGLTVRALSEKTGLSTSTIQLAESGKSIPRVATLTKIADACGVAVADLQD